MSATQASNAYLGTLVLLATLIPGAPPAAAVHNNCTLAGHTLEPFTDIGRDYSNLLYENFGNQAPASIQVARVTYKCTLVSWNGSDTLAFWGDMIQKDAAHGSVFTGTRACAMWFLDEASPPGTAPTSFSFTEQIPLNFNNLGIMCETRFSGAQNPGAYMKVDHTYRVSTQLWIEYWWEAPDSPLLFYPSTDPFTVDAPDNFQGFHADDNHPTCWAQNPDIGNAFCLD